jgi:hypothetical protein
MGLPSIFVMPADGAYFVPGGPAVFVVPGTSRRYTCAAGSAISVQREDATIMCSAGWVSGEFNKPGATGAAAEGTTAQRPTTGIFANSTFIDTTVGALIVYGGPQTGWLNAITGASV